MSGETIPLPEGIGSLGKLQKLIQLYECIRAPSIGKGVNLETIA